MFRKREKHVVMSSGYACCCAGERCCYWGYESEIIFAECTYGKDRSVFLTSHSNTSQVSTPWSLRCMSSLLAPPAACPRLLLASKTPRLVACLHQAQLLCLFKSLCLIGRHSTSGSDCSSVPLQ